MDWFDIDLKLDDELKTTLISIANAAEDMDYYDHFSTGKKRYTNLQFLFIDNLEDMCSELLDDFKIKPHKLSIIRVNPHKVVDWHVDSPKFKRSTVIIFPLQPDKNYAACETEYGIIPYMNCYAFNTNVKHTVVNNDNVRLSLQMFYDIDIEEMHKHYINGSLTKER